MKTNFKSIYTILLIVFTIFFSCTKEKNNLYSISISPNTMVGTPAENFSLQQIKMFQASNNFISLLLTDIAKDSSINNFAVAPLYLINTLLNDTTYEVWQKGFLKHYNLSELSHRQRLNSEKSFLQTVKEIDSSINITTSIEAQSDTILNIFQNFEIKLMYPDAAPNNIDNIFTTFDNKKPRLEFITINGDIRTYRNDNEIATELPIGNGNYMLILIRPLNESIKDYTAHFSEEKYSTLINNMQERKINVSLPLFEINDTVSNLPMPQYTYEDSTVIFPKRLNILSCFKLTKATQADLNANTTSTANNSIFQSNNSEIIKYSSPFLFIVRGKNSNLIMFCGIFCTP
ncbi:MAG: hypothetical protein IJ759_06425 [Bacteroidales bacterium]|nr:hypothetical protein [Bacteroidales bacterium]